MIVPMGIANVMVESGVDREVRKKISSFRFPRETKKSNFNADDIM